MHKFTQVNRSMDFNVSDIFYIIIIFMLLFLVVYDNVPNVLTGIVCIDRDADLSRPLYFALLENNVNDIMVVTRETDKHTIQFWKDKATVVTIPHYEINGRHNMDKIAQKRQLVINYAKKKYDAIWFVDSDLIPSKGILNELIKTNKDVCLAPYRVKWVGSPCIGIRSNEYPYVKLHVITDEDKNYDRLPFIIGGFACTLIKKSTFDIKVEHKEIEKEIPDSPPATMFVVEGEDIGFFMNCYKAGLKCEYLPNREQPHYYDR